MKKTKITQFVNKKTLKKHFTKTRKWLDKPSKLKKWQIMLIVYLVFSFLYIFWPHSSSRVVPSIVLHSEVIKPVEVLKMPELKQVEAISMMDYPIAVAGTFSNTYAPGWCTWGVATMKSIPNNWGNANTWASNAQSQGYMVSNTPMVGTIAQTSVGWGGHVATVIAVSGDTVTVKEMNGTLGLFAYDDRTTPIGDWVYIYI